MSSVEVAAVNGPDKTATAREPVGMVTHLKHLIESLPVCVMRTDLDGCLLAANDSALNLLGVAEHGRVLGKSLTERVSAEHAEEWREFLRRGWSEGASSYECELVDFVGAHRIVLFKAVAQPPHADGIQSLILTAQDLNMRRRLERALQEHEGCGATVDGLRTELLQAELERQRIAALLENLQADADRRLAEPHPAGETVNEQIEALERALAAKEHDWRQRYDDLTNQLAEHFVERQRVTGLLQERDAEQQRLSSLLEERDAEHKRLSGLLHERDAEQQRLSRLLEERDAEHQRLSSLLDQRDAEYQGLFGLLEQRDAEHDGAQQALQKRIEELQSAIPANDQEWQKRCDELTAQLAAHAAERQRLSNLLEQRAAEHAQLSELLQQRDTDRQRTGESLQLRVEELERAIAANDLEWQKRYDELTTHLKEHLAEQERVSKLLEQRHAEYEAAVEGHRQQIEEFERALTANDEGWKQRCEELAAQATAQDEERRQRWEALNAQLIEHAKECQRLTDLLAQREAQRQRLVDDHTAERIHVDALRLETRQLAEDLQRTAEQLERRNAEYEQLTAELNAPRDTAEPMDPAQVQRLMKSVAAYRIELVQVTENTIRTLEPMATAGRVAISSSRELQAAIESVDARSKELLAQCALDDVNRPEIERLRRDSIGAASLVRQLVQVFGDSARWTANGRDGADHLSPAAGGTNTQSATDSGGALYRD